MPLFHFLTLTIPIPIFLFILYTGKIPKFYNLYEDSLKISAKLILWLYGLLSNVQMNGLTSLIILIGTPLGYTLIIIKKLQIILPTSNLAILKLLKPNYF